MSRFLLYTILFAVSVTPARSDELPKPRLPCLCFETGHCTCLPGRCNCPLCKLSAQNRELAKQVTYLKSRVAKYKAALETQQRAKTIPQPVPSRPLTTIPVSSMSTGYPYRPVFYSPSPMYRPSGSYRSFPTTMPTVQGICST